MTIKEGLKKIIPLRCHLNRSLTPIILAIYKAEIRRIKVSGQQFQTNSS
jgi:hypothetical protein